MDADGGNEESAPGEGGAERIVVMARVRPLLSRESEFEELLDVKGKDILVAQGARAVSRYRFDDVFDKRATQADVFRRAAPFVDASLRGFNSTVFAYGQTGTGKTHTMLGIDMWELAARAESPTAAARDAVATGQRGIIPRSMDRIFEYVKRQRSRMLIKVRCTYLEIYNERVYDLLNYEETRQLKSGLEVRQDRERGVYAPDATDVLVVDVLWRGARNRAVSATDMNEHSSRSHTIFQVTLEQKPRPDGSGGDDSPDDGSGAQRRVVRRAKVNLVDLAGSEKWKPHLITAEGMSERRINEMTAINQSLSNLGNCIRALSESGRTHIPYRNSKLTRLLQDSLGGNCKTAFVVTMSPSGDALEESISTLKFADRAKRVVVHASVNETLDDASLVKRYEHEIARLKGMLQRAASARASAGPLSGADSPEGHAQEHEHRELQEENLRLLRETTRLRSDLNASEQERVAICRALGLEQRPLEQARGGVGAGPGVAEAAALQGKDRVAAQLRVLAAQRDSLARREAGVSRREADTQKDQELVSKYHEWLKSLPLATEDDRKSLPLRERLALMEWSVLTQSDDLRRTKALFLREKEELQQELEEALAEASLQAQHAREARIAVGWASPPSPDRTRRRRPSPGAGADAEEGASGTARGGGSGGSGAGPRSEARDPSTRSAGGDPQAAVQPSGLRGVACTPVSAGPDSGEEDQEPRWGAGRAAPSRLDPGAGRAGPQATEPATAANGAVSSASRPASREGTARVPSRRTTRWQELMRGRTPRGSSAEKAGQDAAPAGSRTPGAAETAAARDSSSSSTPRQRAEAEPAQGASATREGKAASGRRRLPEAVKGEWAAYEDPSSGRYYYFNLRTRTTQWETPESFQ